MTTSITAMVQTTKAPAGRTQSGLGRLSQALGSWWSRWFTPSQTVVEAESFHGFAEVAVAQAVRAVSISPAIRNEGPAAGEAAEPLRVYEIHFSAIGRSGRTLRFVDVLTRAPMGLLLGRGSGLGRARAAVDGLANAIYAARTLRSVLPWAAVTVASLSPDEEEAVLEVAGGMHLSPRERYAEPRELGDPTLLGSRRRS
ncbi:MAG: hypothetical protein IT384_03495 [Deltaproteobacteria bacterium]|nr:hypothetical protein [Deltaproteobacteria bacterium]